MEHAQWAGELLGRRCSGLDHRQRYKRRPGSDVTAKRNIYLAQDGGPQHRRSGGSTS